MIVDNCLVEIDEVIEDTMVQLFILQPRSEEAVTKAKEIASSHTEIFYVAPLFAGAVEDSNAVAYYLDDPDQLATLENIEKPLYVDADLLDEAVIDHLVRLGCQGVILGATQQYEKLSQFYLCLDAENISSLESDLINRLSMDEIVFGSRYPASSIDAIHDSVKVVSDAMFRPEQSITARATKSTLRLLGSKKG